MGVDNEGSVNRTISKYKKGSIGAQLQIPLTEAELDTEFPHMDAITREAIRECVFGRRCFCAAILSKNVSQNWKRDLRYLRNHRFESDNLHVWPAVE